MSYLGEEIKKLGFGLMRLPQKDGEIDVEQTKQMVDMFLRVINKERLNFKKILKVQSLFIIEDNKVLRHLGCNLCLLCLVRFLSLSLKVNS